MKTMGAGEFKAKCLRVMEEVRKYRTSVVITKKGQPVAKLVPPDEPKKNIFGCLRDEFTYVGDIESPVLPPFEEWSVARGTDWLTRPEPTRRRKKTARGKKRSR